MITRMDRKNGSASETLFELCVAMAAEVNNVDSVALDRVQTGHQMTRTRPRGQKFTVGRKKHSKCMERLRG